MSASLLLALALSSPAEAGPRSVTPPDVEAAYAPRRVALLVGVDAYSDSSLSSLSFAGKDAADLGRALQDPQIGGYDEVRVLSGAEHTTREALMAAISDVTSDLQRDDTFLLYLSGHGTLTLDPADGTVLWFLPSDGSLDRPSEHGIRVSWLEGTLSDLDPKRRVLILDTCHNGRTSSKSAVNTETASRLAGLKGDPPAPNPVADVTESEARLYAAQYWQPAMEDKSLGNGVYTHFLLDALTEHRAESDLNHDGLVDVAEAHDWAQDQTVRHTGGIQVPRAEYHVVGRERIYLAGDPSVRTDAENALFRAYSGLLASATLLVDGQARGSLDGLVPVEPGRRKLELRSDDGRTLAKRSVDVHAGDFVAAEDLLERHRPVQVIAGVNVLHGPASTYAVPALGELELGARTAPWHHWVLSGEARGSVGYGRWDHPGIDGIHQTFGLFGGGVAFGPTLWHDRLRFALEGEALVPWRAAQVGDDNVRQARFTGAPGLRIELYIPTGGAGAPTLRYDVRAVPWKDDDGWTTAVVHGLAAGVAFR